jgi:hypothetical protein
MKRLLPFILLFILASCSEKDEPYFLQGTFINDGTVDFYPAQIFVKGAYYSDSTVVNPYIRRRALSGMFYSEMGRHIMPAQTVLNFKSDSVIAQLSTANQPTVYNWRYKVFVSRDSTRMLTTDTSGVTCENVAIKIKLYPPTYLFRGDSCFSLAEYPFSIEDNLLKLPILIYDFKHGNSCVRQNGNLMDYFNIKIYPQLQDEDTLLIQTGMYTMDKK